MLSSQPVSENSTSSRGITSSPASQRVLLCLTLFLAVLAVYSAVRRNQFINYDDDAYVTDNAHVKAGLSWETIKWAFTSMDEANWHPVTWMSHAIDCELFGVNPVGHHYINLLLHGLNAILIFLLLQGATGSTWRSFIVAALWSVHPLNVESVAWVAERKNLLSTLFFLLAFAAYVHYARRPSLKRYLVVMACFVLALMSKAQVITFPCLLLLWDYWPLQRIGRPSDFADRARIAPRAWLILEKVPLFLMVAASAWVTLKAQGALGAVRAEYPLSLRLENATVGYEHYLQQAFWPSHLALIYPYPVHGIVWWQVAASAVLLLGVTGCAVAMRQERFLVTGWLWFLGSLVPMIGLIQVGRQAAADRYAYLPLIGLLIAVVWGWAELSSRLPSRRLALDGIASGIVLIALAYLTVRQTLYWHDSITIWSHTLSVTRDNPVAEDNLGQGLNAIGEGEVAYPHFLRAARLNPADPVSHANMGAYRHAHGDLQGAVQQYELALSLGGDRRIQGRTHANLGIAYQQLGEAEKARQQFERALQILPGQFNACLGLGVILQQDGRLEDALALLSCSLQGRPTSDGFVHIGQVLQELGRHDEARIAYSNALQLQPGRADAEKGLATLNATQPR